MGTFLFGRNQKRYDRPVEVCFLCLNYIILVGSTTICLNFVVLFVGTLYCIFYKKKSLLLPTYYEIRGLVGSQDGTNIHSSVPISLYYLPINLDTSVADFIYFRRLVGVQCFFISFTVFCCS